ncbi:MAG: immunoglobulin domain-containing protein [Verrucomicrobiales bacterium]|nr:immunoglobulin domain-containing protein [Verrucomicrobiales bacterium]
MASPANGQIIADWTADLQTNERLTALAVDGQGNIVTTGTVSTNVVTTKYSSGGAVLWSQVHRQFTLEEAAALATDVAGHVWVVALGRQSLNDRWSMLSTLKYTPDGNLEWVGNFPSLPSGSVSLLLDADGSAVIAAGMEDGAAVALKYNRAGTRLWQTVLPARPGGVTWLGRAALNHLGMLFLPGTFLNQGLPGLAFLQRIHANGDLGTMDTPFTGDVQTPPDLVLDDQGNAVLGMAAVPSTFFTVLIRGPGDLGWFKQQSANATAFRQFVAIDPQGRSVLADVEYTHNPLCADCGDRETLYQLRLGQAGYGNTSFWPDGTATDRTFPDYAAPQLQFDPDGSTYLAATYSSRSDEQAPRTTVLLAKLGIGGERLWSTNLPGPLVGNLHVDHEGSIVLATGQLPRNRIWRFRQPRQAPRILEAPESQSILVGSEAILRVHAEAFPSPNYQWRRNGIDLPAETNAFLAFKELKPVHIGEYTVEIRNALGLTNSAAAHLDVREEAPRLSLTRSPEMPTVLAGTPVSFCGSVTGGPKPQLQWFHNGTPIAAATNACLALTNAQPNHSGTYALNASNTVGQVRAEVSLTVLSAVLPADGPRTIKVGDCFTLCAQVGVSPPYTLQWQQDGASLEGATNACLNLCPAEIHHTGSYRLRVTWTGGSQVTDPVEVTAVIEPPSDATIESLPAADVHFIDTDVALIARYSGSPSVLQWRRDGIPLPGQTQALLELVALKDHHAGAYSFTASNAVGSVTSSVLRIAVGTAPPRFSWVPPAEISVIEGASLMLPALAHGGPPPIHTLQHAGTNLDATFFYSGFNDQNSGFLLPRITLGDAGTYQVIASNSFGVVTSSVAVVTVEPAGPVDRWTQRNPLPQSLPILALGHDSQGFLAVSEEGTVLLATEASHWTLGPRLLQPDVRDVAFAEGRWVAAGDGGAVFTSTNRIDWLRRFARANTVFDDVLHAQGRWWVVGGTYRGSAMIAESTDGVTWDLHTLPDVPAPRAMAFGHERFIAVGSFGILESINGRDWREHPVPEGAGPLEQVTFADGRFVAVGDDGAILSSGDGLDWIRTEARTLYSLHAVTRGQGRWVAVGSGGVILTSTDSIHWVHAESTTPDRLETVDWDGTTFVAAGENGTLLSSTNGLDWVAQNQGPTRDLDGMAANHERIVVVGKGGTLLTSADGAAFVQQDSRTFGNLHGVAWGADQWVAVGEPGIIVTSPNGIDWSPRTTAVVASLKDTVHGAGQWIAVGTQGTILRSTNGLQWTASVVEPPYDLNAVAFGDGVFLVAGDGPGGRNGSLFRSEDGIQWTLTPFRPSKNLRGITYANGRFIISANDGRIFEIDRNVSAPVLRQLGRAWNVRAAAWTPAGWVVVGNNGLLAVDSGGLQPWTIRHLGTENLHRVTYFNGSLVAIGNRGTILQSDRFALELKSPRRLVDGGFEVTTLGNAGEVYELQISTNLVDWEPSLTFTNGMERTAVIDGTGGSDSRRFYRLRIP